MLPHRARRLARHAALLCSTLPNTSDDGMVCLGSVRVSGSSVGERVDALLAAFWASRFNQDLRRHPLPFRSVASGTWASRSRHDPLAALSLSLRPLLADPPPGRQRVAGISIADLPAATAPGGAVEKPRV